MRGLRPALVEPAPKGDEIISLILLGLIVTGLAFWMIITPGVPRHPLLTLLVVAGFAAPPLGSFQG
jgi:hypothetical protein